MTLSTIRIGCASAFYGDSQLAARQLVDGGDLDYLVFDYLAESTMAVLSRARARSPELGYAVDFVDVAMRDVLVDCARHGIKVVANAGGVNVPACIEKLESLCEELGLSLSIAGVAGDDLLPRADDLAAEGMPELQTGAPLPTGLTSLNAYLGGRPVAEALAAGADIVVTGRVVDSALVIGPLLHEFNWCHEDYDRLSQAALAGHVIECGAQCAGGNFTDWHLVPDFANISYPVAEVSSDGSFVVTIVDGTGGLVTPHTVAEQVLYEIGDPANYLLPDVACDWTRVDLAAQGENRVKVTGARGRAPGHQYKTCGIYQDGYRLGGTLFVAGERSADKARTSLDALVRRTAQVFSDRGWAGYREVDIEILGTEHVYGEHSRVHNPREVVAKYALHHDSRDALVFAAGEVASLVTSATPGISGFGISRNRPSPRMYLHSGLIDKGDVPVSIYLGNDVVASRVFNNDESPASTGAGYELAPVAPGQCVAVPLERLACARSGDKGNNANIGVVAREEAFLPYLHEQLTAERVKEYFSHIVDGEVTRYDLPGFRAFNFFMTEALGGGGAASLRVDPQGKAFAQMLLAIPIEVPASLVS
ncbi:MAG: acyclic terpene utilization AtuA family protein [Haliea sp.]